MATQRAATVLSLDAPSQRIAVAGNLDVVTQVPGPVPVDELAVGPRSVGPNSAGGGRRSDGRAVPAGGLGRRGARGADSLRGGADREPDDAPAGVQRTGFGGAHSVAAGVADRAAADHCGNIRRRPAHVRRRDPTVGVPRDPGTSRAGRNLQLDSYLTRIIDRELPENGAAVRRPTALRAWLAAYAAATATDANYSTILGLGQPGGCEQTRQADRRHLP